MKFLITGDFHICKKTFNEAKTSLNQILSIIKKEKITDIAILGDVFDNTNPSLEDIGLFINFITSIPKKTKIYIIEGNHDKKRIDKPLLQWITNIRNNIVYDPLEIKLNWNNFNILMVHKSYEESDIIDRNKTESIKELDNIDFIFAGHVHKHQKIKYKNTTLIHPGNIYYLNFKEIKDKQKVVVLFSKEGNIEIKKLKVIPLFYISDTSYTKIDNTLNKLNSNTKVKVKFIVENKTAEILIEITKIINKYKQKFVSFDYEIEENNIIVEDKNNKSVSINSINMKKILNEFYKKFNVPKNIQKELNSILCK